MRRHVLAGLLAAVTLAAAGCHDDPHPSASYPTLQWGTCPDDIEMTFLSKHECGTLTVLQDRSDPDGGRIEMRLVKSWPVGVDPLPGIAMGAGHELGDPIGLNGDAATGATRLRRVTIGLENRGQGPAALPSLACPETDALDTEAAGRPDGDESVRSAFIAAVAACAKRLRAAGVEPAEFGPSQMAADLEDLRSLAGTDEIPVLGAFGSATSTLLDYLAAYPGRATAVFVDSPVLPGDAAADQQASAFEAALHELFNACAVDAGCAADHPDLPALWDRALTATASTPLSGSQDVDGRPVPVLVDDAKLVRFARFLLGGDGPGNLTSLPEIIDRAAHGELDPELARMVATDPVFCAGYRPYCAGQQGFALGVFLTDLCQQPEPSETPAVASDVERRVFAHSPYVDACRAWSVPTVTPPGAFTADVPTLLLSGQLDSWSRPDRAAAIADAAGPPVWAVEAPGMTHNVLGFSECIIQLRNSWSLDPTTAPATTCPAELLAFR